MLLLHIKPVMSAKEAGAVMYVHADIATLINSDRANAIAAPALCTRGMLQA